MGWEKRGNGVYYYRKKRNGKHVRSEYYGTGMSAYLISELDKEEKMERQYNNEKLKKHKGEVEKMNREVDLLTNTVNGFLHATLLTSGYHEHKGQWRKIRNG